MTNNQIVDWCAKGNLVRFYLGNNGEQWGDDWNDAPYEHNAGMIYSEFIKSHKDVCFPYESYLIFPCDGVYNSEYSKQSFVNRDVPFLIVVDYDVFKEHDAGYDFQYWKNIDENGVRKFYFGDIVE